MFSLNHFHFPYRIRKLSSLSSSSMGLLRRGEGKHPLQLKPANIGWHSVLKSLAILCIFFHILFSSWLEEIDCKHAELVAAQVALEKLHQRDQLLKTESEMLKVKTRSLCLALFLSSGSVELFPPPPLFFVSCLVFTSYTLFRWRT